MQQKALYAIAVLGGILLLSSCSPSNALSDIQTHKDTLIVELKQRCINTKYNFTITPDSVLSDSRCPINALCFWAGDANVRFQLRTSSKAYTFDLHTYTGFTNDTTIENIRFKLINLQPYPGAATQVTKTNPYIVTLVATSAKPVR